jgi:hypothetical protein
VLCYIIYHSLSAADNNNNNNINVPAEFKTQVTEATKRELQNYYYMALAEEGRRRRLPDISEVLSQALPKPDDSLLGEQEDFTAQMMMMMMIMSNVGMHLTRKFPSL